jgi:hypothetical protein
MKTIFHIVAGSRHQGSGDAKPDKRGIYSIAAREIPLTFSRRARIASSEETFVANGRRLCTMRHVSLMALPAWSVNA